jgi:hypothetical protein
VLSDSSKARKTIEQRKKDLKSFLVKYWKGRQIHKFVQQLDTKFTLAA